MLPQNSRIYVYFKTYVQYYILVWSNGGGSYEFIIPAVYPMGKRAVDAGIAYRIRTSAALLIRRSNDGMPMGSNSRTYRPFGMGLLYFVWIGLSCHSGLGNRIGQSSQDCYHSPLDLDCVGSRRLRKWSIWLPDPESFLCRLFLQTGHANSPIVALDRWRILIHFRDWMPALYDRALWQHERTARSLKIIRSLHMIQTESLYQILVGH